MGVSASEFALARQEGESLKSMEICCEIEERIGRLECRKEKKNVVQGNNLDNESKWNAGK